MNNVGSGSTSNVQPSDEDVDNNNQRNREREEHVLRVRANRGRGQLIRRNREREEYALRVQANRGRGQQNRRNIEREDHALVVQANRGRGQQNRRNIEREHHALVVQANRGRGQQNRRTIEREQHAFVVQANRGRGQHNRRNVERVEHNLRVMSNRGRGQRIRREREARERTERELLQETSESQRNRSTETTVTVSLPSSAINWNNSQFEVGEGSSTRERLFQSTSNSHTFDDGELDVGTHTRMEEYHIENQTDDDYSSIPQMGQQLDVEGVHDLGRMNVVCPNCRALHWKDERLARSSLRWPKFGTCCLQGKIRLQPYEEPPPRIRALYEGTDARSKSFLENIRQYNNAFAFTSLGSTLERRLLNGSGPYSFIIHGELRHRTGALLPTPPHGPVFSQLYIYDPQAALAERQHRNPELSREVLDIIQEVLLQHNPFIPMFQQAHEILAAQEGRRENIRACLHYTSNKDRRTYNQPTVEEVAVILPGDGTEISGERDIVLRLRNSALVRINESNPLYLPLHYVLLFPGGQLGYEDNLGHWDVENNRESERGHVSLMEYYSYRLFQRPNEYSVLFRAGKLFQEFLVDAWAATEQNRLNYIRTHQSDCRVDLYKDLAELHDDGQGGNQLGQRYILPSSFTGSPRKMYEIYQDSMAITRHYRHPDIFLTMTANPQWKEIVDEIGENRSPSDRPDIVARVFELKRAALMKFIKERRVFGTVVAYVYTIEFQKRGLPHMHALLFLAEPDKIRTAAQVDRFISAELPDPIENPTLFDIVKRRMVHGPCGQRNPNAPCMEENVCTKNYPKSFAEETSLDTDGYPIYRRRRNGPSFYKGNNKIDNRDIVPYNPILTKKFNCHINVEVCVSVRCVKYINKYIYKGHDRTTLLINNRDEIKQYLDARYVGPPEAAWRLYG